MNKEYKLNQMEKPEKKENICGCGCGCMRSSNRTFNIQSTKKENFFPK